MSEYKMPKGTKKKRFEIDDFGGMSEVVKMEFIYPDLTVCILKNGMCVGISSECVCVYETYEDIENCNPLDCTDIFSELAHKE